MTVRLLKVKYRKHEVARRRRQWSSTSCSSSIRTRTRKKTLPLRCTPSSMTSRKASWPKERERFLSKGHPHLRVSALPKRYGWGMHTNAEGKIALVAVESAEYKRLMKDPRIIKIKAFRSKRA